MTREKACSYSRNLEGCRGGDVSSKDKGVCFQIPDCLRYDPWYNRSDSAQPEEQEGVATVPSPARRRGSGGGGCPYSCHSCD